MIYRFVLSVVAMLNFTLVSAAQTPDYKAIKDSINNTHSQYYYPLLMGRYQLADTTLTASDYHYLYYGYPEMDLYRPLLQNSYTDSLSMAFGTRATPSMHTYERIIFLCKGILQQEPFNLRDMNALAFAYSQIGDTVMAQKVMRQIEMVIKTIKNSGTGLTEQSPWYITYYNHAEDIMNLLGASFRRPIIMTRTVEFFPIEKVLGNKKMKGYYFDFAPVYFRRPDYLDEVDKPKRKLEVNPLYNPKSKHNTLSPPKK